MCGISGAWKKNANQSYLEKNIQSMIASLQHRGPDASGVWIESNHGLAFGHNRLAIQDLSSNGNQPMVSSNHRYIIVFNGEIFNFLDLKKDHKDLSNISFNSNSDTEVLLELISLVGLKQTLHLIRGQFAFALWDKKNNELSMCRDRFGEKPLYIYQDHEAIFFASELIALRKIPNLNLEICSDSVKEFLSYGYINHPRSIYKNVIKLSPGSVHVYKNFKLIDQYKFFSLEKDVLFHKRSHKPSIMDIENRLTTSIEKMLISDAPIGAFLSGGIDSSLVCAIASKKLNASIDTFSIGFDDSNHDESSHAETVAKLLNTKHHSFHVTDHDAINYIPKVGQIFSEPFADSSQIPTLLLSELTKQHVTVALSGDGGDELFSGYNRYRFALMLDAFKIKGLNNSALLKNVMRSIEPLFRTVNFFSRARIPLLDNKLEKIRRVLDSDSIHESYNQITKNDKNFFDPKSGYHPPRLDFLHKDISALDYFFFNDLHSYLSEDILTKVDRSSMSHSLEVRSPFLDLELLQMSFLMDRKDKINFFSGKRVLKKNSV